MSWREQLRPGSFRGAPFLIEHHSLEVGRRIALHQYPLRDTPWAEDLGRRARQFRVECFVLGPDYMAARDALIAALEAPGSGTLVHPYFGTRQVVVAEAASVSESTTEGGVCRFTIPFAEAGAKKEPTATTDTAAALGASGAGAGAVLANSFSLLFSAANLPGWVSAAAQAEQTTLLDTLRALARKITTIPSQLLGFLHQASDLSGALSQLITAPADLANSIIALVSGLQHIAMQPLDALDVYGNLLDWVPDVAPTTGTTPARLQQMANRTALIALVRGAAVAGAAAAVAAIPAQSSATVRGFDTRAAALAARDLITAAIDAQQLTAAPDVYAALSDLRVALVRDITERAAALPRLVSYTSAAVVPATVLAWRLYASPARASDIAARNGLIYPGFVPAATALEVLDA